MAAIRRLRSSISLVAAVGSWSLAEREQVRYRFETNLLVLCRAEPAGAPDAALCQRVERYHAELFTFIADPAVPATNNAAERAIRPQMIARTISDRTRSSDGIHTRVLLHSVIATWELRGLDPVAELLALPRAPWMPIVEPPPV